MSYNNQSKVKSTLENEILKGMVKQLSTLVDTKNLDPESTKIYNSVKRAAFILNLEV